MIVHVFDEDEEKAKEKLDKEGGSVSTRDVNLLSENVVYDPDKV